MVRVIWIYSKSVNVVDAKLAVFRNYESFLQQDNIYIHHTLENAENVIIFLASQLVDSLVRGLESIEKLVSSISFQLTLKGAIDLILSRDSIRLLCCNGVLRDKNTYVGTIDNSSYICRSAFTVGRLKEQLVNHTLNEATRYVITVFNLMFKISDELPASINSVLVDDIVAIFYPLLGSTVAVRSLVVTFIWTVDVNSRVWREEIADEIYETIKRNQTDILRKIEDKFQNICGGASDAIFEVLDEVYYFKHRLKQTDQTECKN